MDDKKIIIYPGVDLHRAIRIYDQYIEMDRAKKTGFDSTAWFAPLGMYDGMDEITIYSTRTAIVIRGQSPAKEE